VVKKGSRGDTNTNSAFQETVVKTSQKLIGTMKGGEGSKPVKRKGKEKERSRLNKITGKNA